MTIRTSTTAATPDRNIRAIITFTGVEFCSGADIYIFLRCFQSRIDFKTMPSRNPPSSASATRAPKSRTASMAAREKTFALMSSSFYITAITRFDYQAQWTFSCSPELPCKPDFFNLIMFDALPAPEQTAENQLRLGNYDTEAN